MNNIVPLHRCSCGEVGRLRTITWESETIMFFTCDKCVERDDTFLARVRPIFEAMRACGVPRDIANDAMTYLLERVTDADMLESN